MNIDFRFILTAFIEIIKALPLTLVITSVPLLIGFGIGLVVALIRLYNVKYFYPFACFYVSFLRGTPILLHMMLIYFGLPLLLNKTAAAFGWKINTNSIPVLIFVLIAFSLTAGAYMSEIIRSGILSVNRGQIDAAYSIGMHPLQVMRRIVLPQAMAVSLPNLCNLFVGFLHTSSIAFILSQKELSGAANIVASSNLKFLESYIAAAFIYWGMTILAEWLTTFLEKHFTLFNRGGVA